MVGSSSSLLLRAPRPYLELGKGLSTCGMKMFLQVTFRARSLKAAVGCSLEGGWLPKCRRQGGISGKLWSAGGRELSAAPIFKEHQPGCG